jgi:DNA-binding transcriptional regulator YiaG
MVCANCRREMRREDQMSGDELYMVRTGLGLNAGRGRRMSRRDFALLLGISERSVVYYEQGERPIPARVAREARRLRREAMKGNALAPVAA